jgi:hypothetical protein
MVVSLRGPLSTFQAAPHAPEHAHPHTHLHPLLDAEPHPLPHARPHAVPHVLLHAVPHADHLLQQAELHEFFHLVPHAGFPVGERACDQLEWPIYPVDVCGRREACYRIHVQQELLRLWLIHRLGGKLRDDALESRAPGLRLLHGG